MEDIIKSQKYKFVVVNEDTVEILTTIPNELIQKFELISRYNPFYGDRDYWRPYELDYFVSDVDDEEHKIRYYDFMLWIDEIRFDKDIIHATNADDTEHIIGFMDPENQIECKTYWIESTSRR